MNYASRELGLELFNLTSTEDDYWAGWRGDHCTTDRNNQVVDPKMDLGYLLRKLPEVLPLPPREHSFPASLILRTGRQQWIAGYATTRKYLMKITADTPEDALCKLAIELIKNGIINV